MTALVSRLLALLVIGIACVAALPSAVAATCDATARLTETKKIFGQIFSGDVVGLQSLPFTENNFTFSFSVDGLASVTLTPTKPVAVESTVIIAVVLFQGDNITYVDDGKATVTVNFVGHIGVRATRTTLVTSKIRVDVRYTAQCLIDFADAVRTDITAVGLPVLPGLPRVV